MKEPSATILIVDDEIKNRKLLEILLQHEGYLTVSAANGDEALAAIAQHSPDLILLDVMMPVLDGYQLAGILKSQPLSLHIPIIMVSAQGDRTARMAGLNAGAEEFISKPIDRDELWLRVRNLLRLKSDADLIRNNSALLEERVRVRTLDLQRFSAAMDATADALTLTCRGNMRYIEVNTAACTLLGYTREEMLTMGPGQVVVEDEMELSFDRIIQGDAISQPRELLWRRKDGTEVCVEENRQVVRSGNDWTIVTVARDITGRKDTEKRLLQLAHYDSLTRLPNRRLFQDLLLRAMETADALGLNAVLFYLDVDNFKEINDSLGHGVGDELLRELGERLLGCLNPRDSVGRLGGDEFGVILLTPRNPEIAMIVAEKIHAALRQPFQIHGFSVVTSVSIGMTIYPVDSESAVSLARYADMAMYEAKRSGKNTSRFYTAAMNQRVGDKRLLVDALRAALARKEFVLYYQPKISLRTGRWTGVEALLRWQRPGHGLVPPNLFIPALEESGLIVPVGAWVIATACAQLADWQARGLDDLPIAVNVSALQIAHKLLDGTQTSTRTGKSAPHSFELLSTVAACIENHQLRPGLLEIEITESVIMADADHSIEILQGLRAMGVRLSVDDFGTGYSSLSYLRRFPLESVKIDGSFIRDVTTTAEGASIAVAIIEMAHRLNLKVVAECVETAEQMQFLQAQDCDQAQGYRFARPMSIDELETLWASSAGTFPHLVALAPNPQQDLMFSSAWPECDPFATALLAGSRAPCMRMVEQRLVGGHSLAEIHRRLIEPALFLIGQRWRDRTATVAQEHVGTALALSVMAHALWQSHPAESTGGKVMLACVRGNKHAVGIQMVADAFSLAGWEVSLLGADVPVDVLVEHARQWAPDVIGLSASLPQHVRELENVAGKLLAEMGSACPRILIGGQATATESMAGENGGSVTWVAGAEDAVIAANQMRIASTNLGGPELKAVEPSATSLRNTTSGTQARKLGSNPKLH